MIVLSKSEGQHLIITVSLNSCPVLKKFDKEAINKKFKCEVCKKYNYISDDGITLNEKIYKLISAEPMEMTNA